jgi:hypothetical protein
LSYILVYKENEKIRFNRLKNFNVIFDDCEYPNGKDAKEVVYIDKKKVSPKEYRRTDIGIALQTVLNLKKYEVPFITYWVRSEKGVTTYQIENDEIVSSTTQPIDRIPISRIYAKEVFINYERNWRGLYYLVKDILRTINFEMSLAQERIATAPNHKYWIAEETLGGDTESLSKVNDIPTAFKTYKATSSLAPGVVLPPPTPNDLATNLTDLMQSFGIHRDIVTTILGTISGEERGTETAEAVLLRRENKDTATNDLIKNLLDSSYLIGEIIEQFTDTPVEITSDIFEKAKKSYDLEKIVALCNYVNGNPQAYAILPVLVAKLDVDENTQQTILQLLSQEKEGGAELNNQIQMLEAENKQLKANAESQLITANIEKDSKLAAKQMDMEMKAEEIRLEYAKLGMKQEADSVDLALKAEKIRNDFKKDTAKMQLEVEKFIADRQPQVLIGVQ